MLTTTAAGRADLSTLLLTASSSSGFRTIGSVSYTSVLTTTAAGRADLPTLLLTESSSSGFQTTGSVSCTLVLTTTAAGKLQPAAMSVHWRKTGNGSSVVDTKNSSIAVREERLKKAVAAYYKAYGSASNPDEKCSAAKNMGIANHRLTEVIPEKKRDLLRERSSIIL